MLSEVKMESLPGNITEAMVIKVHKESGAQVKKGEVLFDIEGGKGSIFVKTNMDGTLQTIKVMEGAKVKNGDVLAVIEASEAAKTQGAPETVKKPVPASNPFDYFAGILSPKNTELKCDTVIIGGGPGGYVAAIKAAQMGANVVLVEKENLGGTCLNWGCIPTKALVRSAEVFRDLKNAADFGCSAENINLDMKKVLARKQDVVTKLVEGIRFLMDKYKINVIKGVGELQDKETVLVKANNAQTTIHTKNIIIATGSKASMLNIPGIDNPNVISSNGALALDKLPESMVIVGGGVIGMEFAFIFAEFGVKISIVEYMDECLFAFDGDICTQIGAAAVKKGINVYKGAKVEEILTAEGGKCIVGFTDKAKTKKYIDAQMVMMAVGREPVLESLGLEKVGIELNENGRGIKVDEKMQTNIPNIYAIGDVTDKIMLAHVASHQGIVAVRNIMGESCTMDYRAVPNTVFTDPEIAMVGFSEKTAKEAGLETETGYFPLAANGKALAAGDGRGYVKIVKNKLTGEIIGGTVMGLHATDLIAEIALAVQNRLKAEQLAETIYAHPTTAEAVHEAALALEGGSIHFAQ